MKWFNDFLQKSEDFLQKVDDLAPNPWYIDGAKQARPVTQLGMFIGLIIVLIIYYFFF